LKGVKWAAQAAKLGYCWKVGNGKKIRFWEDQWFGSCSLAIQFWGIYSIINEQGSTISDVRDGVNLKFTFKRTMDRCTMNQWHDLLQIVGSLQLNVEEDTLIW
jgi:hypothetical protein